VSHVYGCNPIITIYTHVLHSPENIAKYRQLQAHYRIASDGILTKIDSDSLYRDLVHRQKRHELRKVIAGSKSNPV